MTMKEFKHWNWSTGLMLKQAFLLLYWSALDVIIRGLILNRSPNEWGMSIIRFI
ncbi:hypothetical protein [Priestia megaterium]|uniref:hypothetical protein n=1 Tax=Priestia megaterium TaxID=1404 RepID=UPI002FFFE165|nr:hypothetical protein [Bacillus sp. S35]